MTTPTKIDRYIIKKELGQGGMAAVFLAHDPRFERDVALKVLPHAFLHDPAFRQRFEREAKTIASLEHKAIVPVYDFGEYEGQPYLVMRHMGGGSLVDRLRQGPVPLDQAARIIARLASALQKAHDAGIIHRDLKPGNILFDESGDAYLADFGIAKLLEGNTALTSTGGVIGTPAYMSPEQAKGVRDLDGRSDIYALGAILFEMLTGDLPYHSDTPMGLVVKHIMEPVPRIRDTNPHLPQGVEGIIGRSMAKEREQRYQTTGQMALDLSRVDLAASGSAGADSDRTFVVPFEAGSKTSASPSAAEAFQPTVIVGHHEEVAAPAAKSVATAARTPAAAAAPPPARPRRRGWLWGVLGLVVVGGLVLYVFGDSLGLGGMVGGAPQASVTAVNAAPSLIGPCANIPAPTQAEVTLHFVNESSFEGVGMWQDRSQSPAQLIEYFRVATGETKDQETFPGDKWVVQEPSGSTLQEYSAGAEAQQCVLIKRSLGNLWIDFVNQSGVSAIGYLVGADGAEEVYFWMGAGATNGLWSASGYVWRVRDGAGNLLLEYSATTAAEQRAVVSP